MDDIKDGDVVELKSGSPDMTVSKVGRNARNEIVAWCDWFDGKTMQRGSFPLHSLVKKVDK